LGKEAVPLGRIWLNVTFSRPNNFWKELLSFEVVDFLSFYHALLGYPCFVKFMAVPNYTYLKLKMPCPNRVITVEGSFKQTYYCEQTMLPRWSRCPPLWSQWLRLQHRKGPSEGRNQGGGGAQPTERQ
jgi:hypothetical protein